MHKAETLSESLLLISLEQPAPRLAQNQPAEHTALGKNKKKRMWTQMLEVVQAQWDQPGQAGVG